MADYEISVNVNVQGEDELDRIENQINKLKAEKITIDIDPQIKNSKALTKSLQNQVKGIIKTTQKTITSNVKGSSITDQFLDPKALSKSLKSINKYAQNLDLGEVKLSVNQSIITDLDNVLNKLNEIKSTAKSMGSIKLNIKDDLDYANGEISVGEKSSKVRKQTIKQNISELKQIAEAEGILKKNLHFNTITQSEYDTQIKELSKKRQALQTELLNSNNAAAKIIADDSVQKIKDKSAKNLEKLIKDSDEYYKVYDGLSKRYNKLLNTQAISNDVTKDSFTKTLNQGYSDRLHLLNSDLQAMERIKESMGSLSGKDLDYSRTELSMLSKHAKEQAKLLENTKQFYNSTGGKYSSSRYLGIDLDRSSATVTKAMDNISASLAKGQKYASDYTASTGKMITTIEKGSGIIEKYQTVYDPISGNANTSLYKVTQSTTPLLSYFDDLGDKFKSLSQYLVGAFGFDILISSIRTGVSSIIELDSAMTELKKTSTATSKEYSDFSEQARIDAKEIGSTATQITSSAADFSRLGYTLDESATLAKTTGILKNVSEFESIDAATEAMISMMKAFDVKVDDSMKLVDKMNLIGRRVA